MAGAVILTVLTFAKTMAIDWRHERKNLVLTGLAYDNDEGSCY